MYVSTQGPYCPAECSLSVYSRALICLTMGFQVESNYSMTCNYVRTSQTIKVKYLE